MTDSRKTPKTNYIHFFIVIILFHIVDSILLWGYLFAVFLRLSKLLLLLNIFQRHPKLDSDLLAASMLLQDSYQLHVHVRLQQPFASEIKIVNFCGSVSSNTATACCTGNKHIAKCDSDQRLEMFIWTILPSTVISNNTFHFFFWDEVMSTSEIFITEYIELALPPSTVETRDPMIFSSFLIQLFNKRYGVLWH